MRHPPTFAPPAPLHRTAARARAHAPHPRRRSARTASCAASRPRSRRAFLRALPLLPLPLLLSPPSRAQAAAAARCLPPRAASQLISQASFPPHWPYVPSDFARYDERPDALFYAAPRLTRHIDARAVAALRAYYQRTLLRDARDVLDVCCSIESYMPLSWPTRHSVVGLGMNAVELAHNRALDSYVVHDLNQHPTLPFADRSFDVVCCALSIDYLTRPRELFGEMARVLRAHGCAAISFSDRVFGTKAIALWMSGANDDHVYTVASYFHYSRAFSHIHALDLSPRTLGGACAGDPLFVVTARRDAT